MQELIMCSDRLPVSSAEYKIKNNSCCNDSNGLMYFDTKKGWYEPKED